jgi:hypothetical protein
VVENKELVRFSAVRRCLLVNDVDSRAAAAGGRRFSAAFVTTLRLPHLWGLVSAGMRLRGKCFGPKCGRLVACEPNGIWLSRRSRPRRGHPFPSGVPKSAASRSLAAADTRVHAMFFGGPVSGRLQNRPKSAAGRNGHTPS